MTYGKVGNPKLPLLFVCVLILVALISLAPFIPAQAQQSTCDYYTYKYFTLDPIPVQPGAHLTVFGHCYYQEKGEVQVAWEIPPVDEDVMPVPLGANVILVPFSSWTQDGSAYDWSVTITVPPDTPPSPVYNNGLNGGELVVTVYQGGSAGDTLADTIGGSTQATTSSELTSSICLLGPGCSSVTQTSSTTIIASTTSGSPWFTAAFADGSTSGQPGDYLTVTGGNWDPNQAITIDFNGLFHSETLMPGQGGEISSQGQFSQQVPIAADATPGSYIITVTQGGVTQTVPISIASGTASATTQENPVTTPEYTPETVQSQPTYVTAPDTGTLVLGGVVGGAIGGLASLTALAALSHFTNPGEEPPGEPTPDSTVLNQREAIDGTTSPPGYGVPPPPESIQTMPDGFSPASLKLTPVEAEALKKAQQAEVQKMQRGSDTYPPQATSYGGAYQRPAPTDSQWSTTSQATPTPPPPETPPSTPVQPPVSPEVRALQDKIMDMQIQANRDKALENQRQYDKTISQSRADAFDKTGNWFAAGAAVCGAVVFAAGSAAAAPIAAPVGLVLGLASVTSKLLKYL